MWHVYSDNMTLCQAYKYMQFKKRCSQYSNYMFRIISTPFHKNNSFAVEGLKLV